MEKTVHGLDVRMTSACFYYNMTHCILKCCILLSYLIHMTGAELAQIFGL